MDLENVTLLRKHIYTDRYHKSDFDGLEYYPVSFDKYEVYRISIGTIDPAQMTIEGSVKSHGSVWLLLCLIFGTSFDNSFLIKQAVF